MENQKVNPAKLVLGKHRVSYVHLKEPHAFEGGDAKYSVTFLIEKGHPDVARIKAAIKAIYEANKGDKLRGTLLTSLKLWNPLRDGDEWLEEHPEASEYHGCMFLKAMSKSQPSVFDTDKQEILDLDEVYSGCYCRASLAGYAFNQAGNKGFGFFLNSVMKMEDGEPLSGFEASPDDYEDEDDLN